MAESNKRMHATADTEAVIIQQRCGAARDARRYVATEHRDIQVARSQRKNNRET